MVAIGLLKAWKKLTEIHDCSSFIFPYDTELKNTLGGVRNQVTGSFIVSEARGQDDVLNERFVVNFGSSSTFSMLQSHLRARTDCPCDFHDGFVRPQSDGVKAEKQIRVTYDSTVSIITKIANRCDNLTRRNLLVTFASSETMRLGGARYLLPGIAATRSTQVSAELSGAGYSRNVCKVRQSLVVVVADMS